MKIIITLVTFFSLYANAVDYICWQQGDYPGFAFQTQSKDCDGKQVESGKPSVLSDRNKEVVCVIPAMCIALTEQVINLLKNRTGSKTIDELKKLNNAEILMALSDSRFTGRMSQVVCKGQGRILTDSFNKLSLDEAKCPTLNDCIKADELFYDMSLNPPQKLQKNNSATTGAIMIKGDGVGQ